MLVDMTYHPAKPVSSRSSLLEDRVTIFGLLAAFSQSLGGPVTAISAGAAAIGTRLDRAPPPLAVRSLVYSAKEARRILHQAAALVRRSLDARAFDLNQLVRTTLADALSTSRYESTCVWALGQLEPVAGDPETVARIIQEITLNAIEAMAGISHGNEARLHISTVALEDHVMLSIADQGIGVASDHERIFELFNTTKPHHAGQGLSVARGLAVANGGMLWAVPNGTQGTRLNLTLPLA